MLSILPKSNIAKSTSLSANDEAANALHSILMLLKRSLEDKLKQREMELGKILSAVDSTKAEKEKRKVD
ncbi:unnamed protein product [Ilex paraguariensis]|uniref:Uncharacterized protein n=1 Tax=Ilex paraguariensis TaxID=185542 RepID=A0ABC8TJV4_9AQUA